MMMLLGIGSELPGNFPGSKVPIKDDAVNAMKTENEVVDKKAELKRKLMSMRLTHGEKVMKKKVLQSGNFGGFF